MSAALDQRRDALKRANVIRIAGAEVKREIRAGQISIGDALTDPRAQRLTVAEFLAAQPRWGAIKVDAFLARHHIFPGRRIERLTERQCRLVAETVLAREAAQRRKTASKSINHGREDAA